MTTKRKKRKRKSAARGGSSPPAQSSGGVMQSIRSGFRAAAGVEDEKKKPSKWSNILWTALLVAALALLAYRMGWFG